MVILLHPGKRKSLPKNNPGRLFERFEKLKARVRDKVEYPFHIIKNLFGHKRTRSRGLAKNTKQLLTLFGFVNLLISKRRLFECDSQSAT